MAAPVRLGRKRPLPVCANPLFVRWLTEWRDEAASRGRRTQFVFQKALRSLRRYPLPLHSGKEAKILQHFGDGLCRMLDRRLQQHKASGDHAPCSPPGAKSPARERPAKVQDPCMPGPTQLKAGGSGKYWPARHSGARAVLLLLYREHLNPNSHGFLTKDELLQRCAQKAPRVAPGSARPWPALRSLLHRNLILRTQQPARYSLTPEGLELAQKLAESEGLSLLSVGSGPEEPPGEEPAVPGAASAELSGASEGNVQQPPLELGPGEYRVLLCVDVGETKGAGSRPELLRELQRLHVTHTVRKLHVGDFVWVAQETSPRDPARPRELVLDQIVERKRLDDLCSSIIDGRFREQKFRLKRCGLGRRVYLVEEHGSVRNLSLPEGTLLQAVTNTQVIDGFFVKRTADIKESAAYLALLTRGLQRLYQAQSVREVFARQLMQVRGVSGEKAAALVDQYSTPASLLAAYDACATPKEKEMLLSTIKCGPLQRNLGPALSRTLSQLYCSHGPLT
ncbi:crossover junction endonuclease MUS81 isoform X3 [Lagenorhynchus albirostris]|uniref:crossover junction endonuclease MUS81 isoform X3 n=1 Tax=Lagenorhynchus albirostris TaxID=27610 RepID=UPI0028F08DB2|nr:crossover junction endonuclease MUS81 isoform X3 [Lagenorhynchus albirostris]